MQSMTWLKVSGFDNGHLLVHPGSVHKMFLMRSNNESIRQLAVAQSPEYFSAMHQCCPYGI